jgi:hypothetical protein
MDRTAARRADSLRAYPNIRAAAKMLDVAASTLSRRGDLVAEARGERDQVLPPGEVMRLAGIYRKRSLNDVAQDLIDLARESSPEDATRVEAEIESYFEAQAIGPGERERFLESARRLLPPELVRQVEAVMAEEADDLPKALTGHPPLPGE